MTLLGIDFDNTLVSYDNMFHKLAVDKGLASKETPANKKEVRDQLRRNGQDEQFTLLQGEVYGKRIHEAEETKGVIEALKYLQKEGIEMVIISHKTRYPYKGPKYDLHESAWNWLEKRDF